MEVATHSLVAQKSVARTNWCGGPYDIGSVATICRCSSCRTARSNPVEGTPAQILRIEDAGEYLSAEAATLDGADGGTREIKAMRRAAGQFDQYVQLNKKIPPEILTSISASTMASPCRRHAAHCR